MRTQRAKDYAATVAAQMVDAISHSGRSVEEIADAAGMFRMVLRWRLTGRSPILVSEVAAVAFELGLDPFELLLPGQGHCAA